MPLPGTRVVHPRFESHLRPTVADPMPCGLAITRAGTGPGTFDPDTGSTSGPARTSVAATRGRVTPTGAQARQVMVGDQVVSLRTYVVAVPVAVSGVRVDDRVEVQSVAADEEPDLLGLVLRVTDATKASLNLQRTLICEEDLG